LLGQEELPAEEQHAYIAALLQPLIHQVGLPHLHTAHCTHMILLTTWSEGQEMQIWAAAGPTSHSPDVAFTSPHSMYAVSICRSPLISVVIQHDMLHPGFPKQLHIIKWTPAMQCHARPCSAMQRHAVPCNAMQCHTMPCNTMQYHAMLYNAIQCHARQRHAMPCNAMQCHTMPCKARQGTAVQWYVA